MKQSTLSIAVLALISQTGAINLDKQVSADDFDGMGESTPVHTVAQLGSGPPMYDGNIEADMKAKGLSQKYPPGYDGNVEAHINPANSVSIVQKHGANFDSELEATENDLNMGMQEEKSLNGIEKSYTQRAPGIGGIDRADANMNNKDAEEEAKAEFKRKLNPLDGLLHNDDGTVSDPVTGAAVEAGFGKKHHKKESKAAPVLNKNSTKSTLA